jgi:hypothetical protein
MDDELVEILPSSHITKTNKALIIEGPVLISLHALQRTPQQ